MLYFAPLQGFTDYIYRKAFSSNFSGIDAFYIPYISLNSKKTIEKQLVEVLPENNLKINAIPQILFRDKTEIKSLTRILTDIGYKNINLNMGCPYPMVTNRGMGSGLLSVPEQLEETLSVCNKLTDIAFSVKLRSGLTDEKEIFPVLTILNQIELSEIIYHPRIAKQLYKGKTNDELAIKVMESSKHPIVFNGDIDSSDIYNKKKRFFPETEKWMLGRGILKNPFLAEEIKGIYTNENEKMHRLISFHEELLERYSEKLSGDGHILIKMKQFWYYFSFLFVDQHRVYKWVKKTNKIGDYRIATAKIFSGDFALV